jgi:hypothetical protein
MDKTEYSNTMEERLRALEAFLANRHFPPPATLEAAKRHRKTADTVEKLRDQTAEALERVEALRGSTDPDWSNARRDLDERWEEITELRRAVP